MFPKYLITFIVTSFKLSHLLTHISSLLLIDYELVKLYNRLTKMIIR